MGNPLADKLEEIRDAMTKSGDRSGATVLAAAAREIRRFGEHPGEHSFEAVSLLASKTKTGAVEIILNSERAQMGLPKAREIHAMLGAAIEAAISDELLFKFLTTKAGLPDHAAAAALLDFRELRQGTRGTSWPS